MYLSFSGILAAFGFFTCVFAKTLTKSKFVHPPEIGNLFDYSENPTYKVGERVEFQWQSDLEYMDLNIYQGYPSPKSQSLMENGTDKSMIWIASLNGFSKGVPKGEVPVLYLGLVEAGNPANGVIHSHYFNVSADGAEETTTTPQSQSEQSPTAAPTHSSLPIESISASATPDTDPEGSGGSTGLSTGAVAGISVGGTIGGILLLAGLWIFIRRRSRNRKEPDIQQTPVESKDEFVEPHPYRISELEAQTVVSELSAQPRATGPTGLYEAP